LILSGRSNKLKKTGKNNKVVIEAKNNPKAARIPNSRYAGIVEKKSRADSIGRINPWLRKTKKTDRFTKADASVLHTAVIRS